MNIRFKNYIKLIFAIIILFNSKKIHQFSMLKVLEVIINILIFMITQLSLPQKVIFGKCQLMEV